MLEVLHVISFSGERDKVCAFPIDELMKPSGLNVACIGIFTMRVEGLLKPLIKHNGTERHPKRKMIR